MKKRLLGMLKGLVLVVILTVGVIASVKEVKANSCSCGNHTYEITGTEGNKTVTISGSGEISSACGFASEIEYNTDVKNVIVETGITVIGTSTFNSFEYIEKVTLPTGVTAIGNGAFYDCKRLKSINIPEGVTSIGNSAFNCCRELPSIIIPNSVKTIGTEAFMTCQALTSVGLPKNSNFKIIDANAFNDSGVQNITIPANVTSIRKNAFANCDDLKNITIEGAPEISEKAFDYCNPTTLTIKGNPTIEKIILPYGTSKSFTDCEPKTVIFGSDVSKDKIIEIINDAGFSDTCKTNLTVVVKDTATKDELANSFSGIKIITKSEYDALIVSTSISISKKNTLTQEQIAAILRLMDPEFLNQIEKSYELQVKLQALQQEYA